MFQRDESSSSLETTDALLRNMNSNGGLNNGFGCLDGDMGRLRNCSVFCNASTGIDVDIGNGNGGGTHEYPYGFTSLATNLIETNNGVAQQSNIVDELNTLKRQQHRQLHRYLFPPAPSENNKNSTNKDDVLVSELTSKVNNLSLMERQEAQNDIYGFRSQDKNQIEDPEQLGIWLNEMDDLIQKGISTNDKRFWAMRLAMNMNITHGDLNNRYNNPSTTVGSTMSGAEYVRSQKLKFLRSGDWLASHGVTRMARFFELKLEYFGPDALIRDLTINDLTPTDLAVWKKTGFLQVLEERDSCGRAIMILTWEQTLLVSTETIIRCIIYLSTVIARDESVQVAGSIGVGWVVGQHRISSDHQRQRLIIEVFFRAIPIRMVSRHFCYDQETMRASILIFASVGTLWGSIRFLSHFGTVIECLYNLMTCGIPRNALPFNNEGGLELDFHQSFLEAVEQSEALDRKIRGQEQLLQYQSLDNNTIQRSQVGNGILDQRGETYPREPPTRKIEKGNNELSWELPVMPRLFPQSFGPEEFEVLPNDPLSLGSDNLEGLPVDFMKQLADNLASEIPSVSHVDRCQKFPPRRTNELILVPGVLDVIMGRGRQNSKKPGNQKLNQLLESHLEKYEASTRFEKTVMTQVVASQMMDTGSRFLVLEGGFWVEVPLEKARSKVSHGFRNLRLLKKTTAKTVPVTAIEPFADAVSSSTNNNKNEIGAPKRQRSQINAAEEKKRRET